MSPAASDVGGSRRGRPGVPEEPGLPGLVAVHAHPDDETLATGALLATWSASGAPVTVVTCTRGERGEVIGPELGHLAGDGPALAAHRERELAAALDALGVPDHVWLDALPDAVGAARYEDSGMVWVTPGRAGAAPDSGASAFARADVETAARRLAALLRERRPGVVVTYEPGGGYGHPDHVQAHRVTMRAVELAAEPRADLARAPHTVQAVLWAAVDSAARARAFEELVALVGGVEPDRGLRLPTPDRAAPTAAVAPEQVDLRLDVLPVLDRVVGALRAHATQVQGVRVWPHEPRADASLGRLALSDGVLQPLLRHEAYRVARGSAAEVSWPAGMAG